MRVKRLPLGFAGRLLLFALALGVAIMLGIAVASAQSKSPEKLGDKKRELQALRAQIKSSRDKADALARNEDQQLERLQALEQEEAGTKKLLHKLDARLTELKQGVQELESEVALRDSSMQASRGQLAAQLRRMYMYRSRNQLALFTSATDLNHLVRRMKALTTLARAERRFLDEVERDQSALDERKHELRESLVEIETQHAQVEQQRARIEALRQEKDDELKQLKAERHRWEASTKELEHSAAKLEELMARLEKQRQGGEPTTTANFESLKGVLAMPVPGRITRGFGRYVHPKFKTVVVNKGINIAAPVGTPIRAVAPGVVDYVNWLPGYGKCIIVNHGRGWYTLYAHCSKIYPGVAASVQADEVIAEVGDTGSLDGSQLYFEIRHGKKPVDPEQWLNEAAIPSR